MGTSKLRLAHQYLPHMSVIAIAGEASRITSGQVTDYLARIRRPGDQVIVDLSGLRLLDASGIQAPPAPPMAPACT
ncbi:hypothetical protein ACIA8R_33890 [Nonomuraea sp. NPDC051191]|uniref:hypothetical protein n=1 Tax=Nonomuraea sp. NPDC051191 TaxID=3364372 RepID=UPI0037908A59